jgi:hypothetical protein
MPTQPSTPYHHPIDSEIESGENTGSHRTAYISVKISVWVAALAFLAALLIVNHDLFTKPIMAYSDFAANGLQILRAKHFRELLGNYSRWSFHHPGPGFFYIFAFGEAFFRDVTHIVRGDMSAHILTIILLNTAFLFGTIGIIARRCQSTLFTPVALALSLFLTYILNQTVPASAVISIWMPHVLLFSFLFYVAVSAAVAMGEVSKLPLMAFTGLLLIHGHAAQPLFVGTLGLLSLVMLWAEQVRPIGLRSFISQHRGVLIISAALVALFAAPIVIEAAIHKPSNLRDIMEYSSQHKGIENKPRMAWKYELSFFDFIPDTEIQIGFHPSHLMATGGSKPYVASYWCIGCLMIGLAIGLCTRRSRDIPLFFKYLAAEIGIVYLVFFYWSLKMAGPLFNFNGYFIYGMQFLLLFLLTALILDGLSLRVHPALAMLLCVLIPATMFAAKSGFRNAWTGDPETDRLYASLPADMAPVHLTFPPQDWLTMVGISDRLKHENRPFCVDSWAATMGPDDICKSMDGYQNLVLTREPLPCDSPCRVLTKDEQFELLLIPYPHFKLPVEIKPDNVLTMLADFHANDDSKPVWSSKRSTIFFRLAPGFTTSQQVRIRLLGIAAVDRPVRVTLNDHPLGTIKEGLTSYEFTVDRSMFTSDADNQLVLQVDNKARVGYERHSFGFLFSGLQLDPAQ